MITTDTPCRPLLLRAAPGSAGRVHQVRSDLCFLIITLTYIAHSGLCTDLETKTEFFREMVNKLSQSMGTNTTWHTHHEMLEHAVEAQKLRHPAYDQSKDMSDACKGVYALRYQLEQLLDSEECSTVWKHWPDCISEDEAARRQVLLLLLHELNPRFENASPSSSLTSHSLLGACALVIFASGELHQQKYQPMSAADIPSCSAIRLVRQEARPHHRSSNVLPSCFYRLVFEEHLRHRSSGHLAGFQRPCLLRPLPASPQLGRHLHHSREYGHAHLTFLGSLCAQCTSDHGKQRHHSSEACRGVYAFRYQLEQLLDSEECDTT